MTQSTPDQHPVAAAQTDPRPGHERSLGEVVGALTTDLTTLFKQEIELAKVEAKQEAGRAGKGAGLLGAAAMSALLLLVFASLALTYLLDNWLPAELAALIVALLWGVAAAVTASAGRTALKNANPQLPQTQQTLKEDAAWARNQRS
jgi:uncharacterized membrane protein YqjE